ncbi:MAG TPA: DUF4012 domain-containing protein, partial [Ktedonobacterales bacterium]|nr:DUF4012 domain-containing protein [Ktedonobacterales bacterium]
MRGSDELNQETAPDEAEELTITDVSSQETAPVEVDQPPVVTPHEGVSAPGHVDRETVSELATVPIEALRRGQARLTPNVRLARGMMRRRRRARHKRVTLIVSVCVLLAILLPAGIAIASALQDYTQLKSLGSAAVHHVLKAKEDLLPSSTSSSSSSASCSIAPTPTATPTSGATAASKLPTAQQTQAAHDEFILAQRDFQQLQARLSHPDWILGLGGDVPSVAGKLSSVRALANAGVDVSTIGVEATSAALPVLTRLHGASGLGSQELLQQADITAIQRVMDDSMRLLTDVQAQVQQVDVASLPVCASQKAEFNKLVGELPTAMSLLKQGDQLLPTLTWALGIGQPRTFLVQTLDRAELRPSGGFTGDYGLVTIQNGKVGPFTLTDVDRIDYNTGYFWTAGRRAPSQYAWWPFGNWGLRDANLSADYPTNAQMVANVFHNEGGPAIDGVIEISPIAIEHVLKVTGPLLVPGYNETITADNLEAKLHYYQQDPAGIAKEQALSPDDTTTSVRKRFTSLVGRLLEQRVRALPLSQLKPLARQILLDMQSKDIQVYVNNPKIENLLTEHHAAGALDTSAGVDSMYLVQANVSVAKSSEYVNVVEHDDITLDAQGGATHNLTVTMKYDPMGNVYGYSTYSDYVRLYVPAGATLLSADGFDSGQSLCWTAPHDHPTATKPDKFKTVPDCTDDPYPNGELTCPTGFYGPGNKAPSLTTGSDGTTP